MNSRLLTYGMGPIALLSVTAFLATPTKLVSSYKVQNLLSNGTPHAAHTNTLLQNGWGIARAPLGPWWINAAETGTSIVFDSSPPLNVAVPGNPTGIVFNGGAGFVITDGTNQGPARFMFASEDGTISGWNPLVPPPAPSHQAFVAVNRSAFGDIFKGLAIATTASGPRIYATDFHHGVVEVFDSLFAPVVIPGAFIDPTIPAGFAPFGIQALNGQIYVTYAMQDAAGEDEIDGETLGYVSVFTTAGAFIARVASQGALDAPWGLTIAPATGFGPFSGALLVGNFGDGHIHGYDPVTFQPLGPLKTNLNRPVAIDGLWGIGFGNDAAAGPSHALYFAAGPDKESNGVFGKVTLNP